MSGDPYYATVSPLLLLLWNNGSTTFTDYSSNSKTVYVDEK